jgi:hypothetical protein
MAENNEARNYLDAYDRWLKLFQMNSDYYFKRTQIVMIVIQSALFVAFTKSAWDSNTGGNSLGFISLGLIPFLGIFASLAWYTMITKHHDYITFGASRLQTEFSN